MNYYHLLNQLKEHEGFRAHPYKDTVGKTGEKYERYAGTDQWPAYAILPTTPWNYALVLNERDTVKIVKILQKAL